MADRRATDVSKLSFPLQIVVLIVATMASVFASNYATRAANSSDQAQTRSDVRDILTRLQLGAQIAEAQAKANEERFNALKAAMETQAKTTNDAMAAVQRRQEMQQIQISQLNEAFAKFSAQQQGRR